MARELGMCVDEMLSRMSSRELTEWIAFFALESKDRESALAEAKVKSNVDNLTQKARQLK